MKKSREKTIKKWAVIWLAGITAFSVTTCGGRHDPTENLVDEEQSEGKIVNLFGPMEKSNPNADNIARTAFDLTIAEAEKDLGLTVEYRTYTAENYK